MEDVDEDEVEELLCPEKVKRGEPGGLQPQGGRGDQAGHQHGEDRPPGAGEMVMNDGDDDDDD